MTDVEPTTSDPAVQTGRVTFSRASSEDIGERQVIARIDDGERHTLYFGDRVTIEVPAGSHRLRVHNTLVWKTMPFTLEAGQHLEFELVNYPPRFAFSMLALVGAGPVWLRVERREARDGGDGTATT